MERNREGNETVCYNENAVSHNISEEKDSLDGKI